MPLLYVRRCVELYEYSPSIVALPSGAGGSPVIFRYNEEAGSRSWCGLFRFAPRLVMIVWRFSCALLWSFACFLRVFLLRFALDFCVLFARFLRSFCLLFAYFFVRFLLDFCLLFACFLRAFLFAFCWLFA